MPRYKNNKVGFIKHPKPRKVKKVSTKFDTTKASRRTISFTHPSYKRAKWFW